MNSEKEKNEYAAVGVKIILHENFISFTNEIDCVNEKILKTIIKIDNKHHTCT